MKRTLIGALLVANALLPARAWAGSVSAKMTVSAQVIARAIARVETAPVTVSVSAADVARGYVDLLDPLVVHVVTNSRAGCVLQVVNASETFAAVELETGSLSMHTTGESFMARPYVRGGESLSMKVRLRLSREAREGQYAFPVEISAEPLG